MDTQLLQHALDLAFQHVARDAQNLTDFPHRTVCDAWETTHNEGWVEGFWAGLLWLRYAYSGSSAYEAAARHWTDRLLARTHDPTHDLGFLFEPGAVAGYRLTGDSRYRDAALEAAHTLKLRLRPGGFIQAFSTLKDNAVNKIVLIDTMMNLKLLNWAARETGDDSFAKAATTHASNTIRSHVRDDGRTYHVVRIDPRDGVIEGPQGGQGLTPQSCWSRGQAWALYGFTTMARETGDPQYLDTARLIADCWIRLMAGQPVPPWDFGAPIFLYPVPHDTSAGAIAAAGLLDLAAIAGADGVAYREHALALLIALSQDYLNPPDQPGILREGCSNLPQGQARQALIYGDYYFVEALTRVLHPDVAARILGY